MNFCKHLPQTVARSYRTNSLVYGLLISCLLALGASDAFAIVHGNALWFSQRNFVGENFIEGSIAFGNDPDFDYNNPDPAAFERSWHSKSTWFLQTDHADAGADCDDPEQGTCGVGVSLPGIPTNYNPDYGIAGLFPANPDFPTTPIDPNDPFDPLASIAFNNANALGPNPAKMLRTKTNNGSPGSGFTTFSTSDPFIAQRPQVNGREADSASPADLDTLRPIVIVIQHDIFLPVDVDNPVDNGGRDDGIIVGRDKTNTVTQLDMRAGIVTMEGQMSIGNGVSDSRNTFNITGGTLNIGAAAESTPSIEGGELNNFRDARLNIGTGSGGNAPGVFNHIAGDVSISGAIDMASTGTGKGAIAEYNMSPGTNLTLHRLGGDETAHIYLADGTEATATFNQNGGTVTVDSGIHLGRHGGLISPVLPILNTDPGLGIYNLVGSSSSAGDFDEDGDVDGGDFLLWQRDTNVGDLADWKLNYGSTGSGGGGVTTLVQGTSTTFDGDSGESQRDAIVVGNAGFGQLNIDSTSGEVVLDANALLVAARDTTLGPTPTGTKASTGLVNIIGNNATITIGDLAVGEGTATFRFESDSSGISPISVVAAQGDPINLGDVDISGATLVVDLSNLASGSGDLLLIDVGGTLTGEFAGLSQGASVGSGYSISYLFGNGNDIGLIASGGITAVPEPTSIALTLLAVGFAGFGRQQRRR